MGQKWVKRLQAASADDDRACGSRSRARKTPPPSLSTSVIDRILAIRDTPPHGLNRVPGPKAILYYLQLEASTTLQGERLPRSTRTIWQILRQHQRIVDPVLRVHHPLERPEPLQSWQLDFKDASTVPPDPDGKRQHVVEVLNTVDVGTSLLIDAQVRADFTMATAIEAVAATVQCSGPFGLALPHLPCIPRLAVVVIVVSHSKELFPFDDPDCPVWLARLYH